MLFQTCLRPRGKSSHWAALPRARKTKPANEMYLKKEKEKEKNPHTSGFQTALKLLHSKTFSKKKKKKHPAIALNRIKTLPKMITQAY